MEKQPDSQDSTEIDDEKDLEAIGGLTNGTKLEEEDKDTGKES